MTNDKYAHYRMSMELKEYDLPPSSALKDVQSILDLLGEFNFETGPWIAGGAVRRLAFDQDLGSGDIDIFAASHQQISPIQSKLDRIGELTYHSSYARTYLVPVEDRQYKVQLIIWRSFATIRNLFKTFDFTVCDFVSDGQKYRTHDQALSDILNRKLRFNDSQINLQRSVASRAVKYISMGYEPVPGFLKTIMDSKDSIGISRFDSDTGGYNSLL